MNRFLPVYFVFNHKIYFCKKVIRGEILGCFFYTFYSDQSHMDVVQLEQQQNEYELRQQQQQQQILELQTGISNVHNMLVRVANNIHSFFHVLI